VQIVRLPNVHIYDYGIMVSACRRCLPSGENYRREKKCKTFFAVIRAKDIRENENKDKYARKHNIFPHLCGQTDGLVCIIFFFFFSVHLVFFFFLWNFYTIAF